MPETEALEITMVIAAGEAILATQVGIAAEFLRQPQAEIRLESVNLTDEE
jgi:hypothetical protein